MLIFTVVGARPQFIKAAPFSRALADTAHTEFLVHTGQHYDDNMSEIFFQNLQMSAPDVNLGIGGGSHASQTAGMIVPLEDLMITHKPDVVLVYGDTNSTLAAALAASKLHIPIAHVEAGLRSYNRKMPEEINRVLTDTLSTWLFCPTQIAVDNLVQEGMTEGVHQTGDIMHDAMRLYRDIADEQTTIFDSIPVDKTTAYALLTTHRPANTDSQANLTAIAEAISTLDMPVIFPVHPRTKSAIDRYCITFSEQVRLIDPVGYLDMLSLQKNAQVIITDSGGLQKEAFFNVTPCVTIRPETEWVETVDLGWNRLVDPTVEAIHAGVREALTTPMQTPDSVYGDGYAAQKIIAILEETLST
ncbi:MAG: UDP-N-acetylglucosamine 2-epimerase (non-hydrolyzing) [Chloroflexota bacterium]